MDPLFLIGLCCGVWISFMAVWCVRVGSAFMAVRAQRRFNAQICDAYSRSGINLLPAGADLKRGEFVRLDPIGGAAIPIKFTNCTFKTTEERMAEIRNSYRMP